MAPENTTEVTHGEVVRALGALETKVDVLTAAVNSASTKSAADYVRIGHLEARIVALEDWQKWAQRLVLAAVIAAVVGLVIVDPWAAR
ncbi:hypothetical protein [Cellulosimicrobium sp. I38E]|uniref:hypothetical protein n=1 Tax=Cellulosimicrobium sp. I38E TaxID=1393139 RepID=UPI0007B25AE1|nr:hypothetical protein [Cellulosimicrobium sp. I38E]KZM76634.1 hypothetical protein A0J59_20170 [Cellulosimicrobium sp. I38E]